MLGCSADRLLILHVQGVQLLLIGSEVCPVSVCLAGIQVTQCVGDGLTEETRIAQGEPDVLVHFGIVFRLIFLVSFHALHHFLLVSLRTQ